MAELAVNLSSKTAEAIAKPLLEIISKPSPISDQPTNTEEEKEAQGASCPRQEACLPLGPAA